MSEKELPHTPEPWALGDTYEICALSDQFNMWYMAADCHGPQARANARRIVACVNACAGVDNETLDKIASGEMIGSEIAELARMRKQRDALLAALQECDEYLRASTMENIGSGSILHQRMIEAIAAAT